MRRRQRGDGFQRPIAAHNQAAFDALLAWRASHPGPLVLDSGCGNGESSLALSEEYPDAWIIGIDKTAARLQRRGLSASAGPLHSCARCCFLLADLVDLWRLLAAAGWRFERHYLLYPNPWPKPALRLRRWPLHPLWPTALALSDRLELRTNWEIYAQECELALRQAGWRAELSAVEQNGPPLTPFEAKYRASGHDLWRVSGSAPTGPDQRV